MIMWSEQYHLKLDPIQHYGDIWIFFLFVFPLSSTYKEFGMSTSSAFSIRCNCTTTGIKELKPGKIQQQWITAGLLELKNMAGGGTDVRRSR